MFLLRCLSQGARHGQFLASFAITCRQYSDNVPDIIRLCVSKGVSNDILLGVMKQERDKKAARRELIETELQLKDKELELAKMDKDLVLARKDLFIVTAELMFTRGTLHMRGLLGAC
jgi:hypothetical protein